MDNRQKTIPLTGRIDSNNAAAVEQELLAQLGTEREIPMVLDAKDLFMLGRGLDYSILMEGSL